MPQAALADKNREMSVSADSIAIAQHAAILEQVAVAAARQNLVAQKNLAEGLIHLVETAAPPSPSGGRQVDVYA